MQTFHLRRFSTAFISAFAAIGLLSGFHHGGKKCEERLNRATEEITTRLNLDETQQSKLEEVKQEILKVREESKSERLRIVKELKSMIQSDRLDPVKAKRIFMRKQMLAQKNFDRLFRKIQEFHATLTDEQKALIADKLTKLENRIRGSDDEIGNVEEDIEEIEDVEEVDDFR